MSLPLLRKSIITLDKLSQNKVTLKKKKTFRITKNRIHFSFELRFLFYMKWLIPSQSPLHSPQSNILKTKQVYIY